MFQYAWTCFILIKEVSSEFAHLVVMYVFDPPVQVKEPCACEWPSQMRLGVGLVLGVVLVALEAAVSGPPVQRSLSWVSLEVGEICTGGGHVRVCYRPGTTGGGGGLNHYLPRGVHGRWLGVRLSVVASGRVGGGEGGIGDGE